MATICLFSAFLNLLIASLGALIAARRVFTDRPLADAYQCKSRDAVKEEFQTASDILF